MGENSKIEWTDHTWNPWTGCTKVSPACDHCYAEGWAKRSGHVEWGPHGNRRRTSESNWKQPLKWNREAEAAGVRRKVFCASLADVFDNHKSILLEWRDDLWNLIQNTPNLDWLLLTKRPQNVARMVSGWMGPHSWPSNVWLGTTVENQEEADRRIPHLLAVPAAVRFLSCEPLLGPIDLLRLQPKNATWLDCLNGREHIGPATVPTESKIDWVIVGGESGHGARPMHPGWARSLRDQCAAAGTPFFFKQWGDWLPGEFGPPPELQWQGKGPIWDANQFPADFDNEPKWDDGLSYDDEDQAFFFRAGKKRAGRLLDGKLHDGFPAELARKGAER